MKVLFINSKEKSFWEEEIDLEGILDLSIFLHLEKYKSYRGDVFSSKNVIVIGTSHLNFPGAQRATVVFRSPLHGGINSATLGGFGEFIKRAGYSAIVIEGKGEDTFLLIKDEKVKFIHLEPSNNIFSVEKKLYAKFKSHYNGIPFRIMLIGSGSKNTNYGCLVSSKPQEIGKVMSVAGRGGVGSVLYKAHGIVGIAIGGKAKFNLDLDASIVKEQMLFTKKYREEGTFLANYLQLKENVISFNGMSTFLPSSERLKLFEKFIKQKLLKDYKFKSETCGEYCIAVCKKLEKDKKVDYECVHANGPFLGIFERKYAVFLAHLVNDLGIDAIYLGYVLGAVFEALSKGLISPSYFELKKSPSLDWKKPTSKINFEVAKELIYKIGLGKIPLLGNNLRQSVKKLKIQDLAIYLPHGKDLDITPPFYWSLGVMLPVVFQGKFFSDYSISFEQPETYAKICAERTIKEYIFDNLSICRFQRGWIEKKFGKESLEKAKNWIKKAWKFKKSAKALPQFWESKRTLELVNNFFKEFGKGEWKEGGIEKLKEYWKTWQKTYLNTLDI